MINKKQEQNSNGRLGRLELKIQRNENNKVVVIKQLSMRKCQLKSLIGIDEYKTKISLYTINIEEIKENKKTEKRCILD